MRSRTAVPLLFLLAACEDTPNTQNPPPSGCDVPEHAQWASTTPEECGIAPGVDGGISVVLCHWTIALESDGTGTWSHSDVTQSFTYSCNGAALELTMSGTSSSATYDASSGHLTYDEVAYCPADELGCPPG